MGLFRKMHGKHRGLSGVTLYPGGVALAHVERTPGQPPALKVCDYQAGNDHATLLKELVHKHRLQHARCVLCLHPTQYASALIERPDVEDSELQEALRWRIADIVDYPVTEAVIDALEPVEGTVEKEANQITVVALRRALAEQMHQLLTQAELVPVAFDILELCQRNISELLPESDRGVLFVQLRHTMTQMFGFQQGQLLLSRRTNVLGNELTDELTELDQEAPHGLGTLENLTVEIQRTVTFYSTRARRGQPSGLVIVPFVHELPGLCTHLTQMVDITARPLDLNVVLDAAQPLPEALQANCVDAVGAALRIDEEAA